MEGMPVDRPADRGCTMLGFRAVLVPLEKGAYAFELELASTEDGVTSYRTIGREVLELVPVEDLEMAFVGCVVTHIVRNPRRGAVQ